MVQVVEESIYGKGYKEINQQLARENNELRQQLGQALQEICQQQAEIHNKDVEIVQLKSQLNQLKGVREKYKRIKEIISRESICEESTSTNKENNMSQLRACIADQDVCYMTPIHEISEHEANSEDERSQNPTKVSESDDSLVPPEVTSVPPVDYCERTMQTPSIWNCLDTLGSPSSFPRETHHNNDNLHSTPVQPMKVLKKKMSELETPKSETFQHEESDDETLEDETLKGESQRDEELWGETTKDDAPRDESPRDEAHESKTPKQKTPEPELEQPCQRYNLRKRTKR